MEYATFDRSQHPLITVTFTGEKATDSNFATYLEETTNNYDSKEQIGIVFDATKAKFPAVKYQKIQAAWLKENDGLMRSFCAGIAYTIPNSLI